MQTNHIKRIAKHCAAEALSLPRDVALVVEEEIRNRDYDSIQILIDEAHENGNRLPATWGMPELKGATIEEAQRAYLNQLLLSMAYDHLKLRPSGDAVVISGLS